MLTKFPFRDIIWNWETFGSWKKRHKYRDNIVSWGPLVIPTPTECVLLPHPWCRWEGPCVGRCSPPGRCGNGAWGGRRPDRWPSAPSLAPGCRSGSSLWFGDTAGCRARRADPGYSTHAPPPDGDRQRAAWGLLPMTVSLLEMLRYRYQYRKSLRYRLKCWHRYRKVLSLCNEHDWPPQRDVELRLGLGDMEKIKYHDIFDQILWYRYRNNIVVLTIGAFTKYLHNDIFDK